MGEKFLEKIIPEGFVFQFSLSPKYLNYLFSFNLFLSILFAFLSLRINFFFLKTLLFILSLLFLILAFFQRWYLKKSHQYFLTKKRIISVRGLLSREVISIDFAKITDIKVEENFWERIFFNSGKLIIETAGQEGPELILERVEDPFLIKRRIDEIQGNGGNSKGNQKTEGGN